MNRSMPVRPAPCVRGLLVALLLLGATRASSSGQVPWESPQLVAPGTQRGVSLLYVDYGLRPLDGTGLLLAYRPSDAPRGPAFRIAATLPDEDDVRLSGGVDIAVAMLRHSPAFPLDVAWVSGIGASYGDYYSIGVPIGVAASRVVDGRHIRFQPYTSARVVLEAYFGDDQPDESFGLAIAADVGADISLRSARSVILRTAVSLGDRRAMAIGLQLSPRTSPVAAR